MTMANEYAHYFSFGCLTIGLTRAVFRVALSALLCGYLNPPRVQFSTTSLNVICIGNTDVRV